jgi:N-acetylmuramoyl-L-alanine amidase
VKYSFLVLIAFCALHSPAAAQSSLRIGDATVDVQRINGHPMVSAAALTSLGARTETVAGRTRVVLYGDTITLTAYSPFFSRNREQFQLASAPVRAGATLWIPLQFFSSWLPAKYSTRVAYASGVLRPLRPVAVAEAQRPRADSPRVAARTDTARITAPPTSTVRQTRVVVLDAGHGGRDSGKPGPNGVLEKNAALLVVNRLAGFLRERGYEVHLTRSRDTLISLADRPHMANVWKNGRPAALFMSVHANSGARAAKGFETYFLSEARTEDERRVAEMENAAVQFEEKKSGPAPELDQIVSGLKNDFYLRASHALAQSVQSSLATVHGGPNRGVKQAGFRVLIGALMPAVLVEMAFISNPDEAQLLGTSAFQQKIAFSLAAAIDHFFATHQELLSQ